MIDKINIYPQPDPCCNRACPENKPNYAEEAEAAANEAAAASVFAKEWADKAEEFYNKTLEIGIDTDNYYTKSQTNSLLSVKANVSQLPDMSRYYNKNQTDTLLTNKADSSSVYTKTEINEMMADIPDVSNYYTKTQTDDLLADKADTSDLPDMTQYYNKTQTDDLLADKADTSDLPDMTQYYNKTQTDNLLADKADTSDLPDMTQYYNKTQTDTLLADKLNKYSLGFLNGSSYDLDTYNTEDKNGFYTIGASVQNSPVAWSIMLVLIGPGAQGGIQMVLQFNGCYVRSLTGSPLSWTAWRSL